MIYLLTMWIEYFLKQALIKKIKSDSITVNLIVKYWKIRN